MKQFIHIRNQIRDFLRKYDEISAPALRIVWCLAVFISIRHMYGYFELVNMKSFTLLLSLLCALMPEGFMFFAAGAVMASECFSISTMVGLAFCVFFLLIYCVYTRFFSRESDIVLLIPILILLHLKFAAPLIILVTVGAAGALPAFIGLFLYQFSVSAGELKHMLAVAEDPDKVEVFKYLTENVIRNQELILLGVTFMLVILISMVLFKLPYKYFRYVGVGACAVLSPLVYVIVGKIMKVKPDTANMFFGVLVGLIVAAIVRILKGVLDYKHTEHVEFEDDDYFYYVKAVPKLGNEKRRYRSRAINDERVQRPMRAPMAEDETAPIDSAAVARRAAERRSGRITE